jgi:hypothetical protein
MSSNQYLDTISKTRAAYVMARTTLEQRLREQLKEELSNLQTQVDIAVRYAYDAKLSKASILRAMGTKDYHTLNACLERTKSVSEIVGEDPLNSVYHFDPESEEFTATYNNHGPDKISGKATFYFRILQDGTKWFMSRDPLWSSDFTVRNDVVAALDNKQDGYYYEEALEWVSSLL